MEESREIHTDENRALPEKKQKRIVKTPSQVAALENFYNEHKYPTEAMKLELAESIGLTEKQVSGWFCHRRLKDKKTPNDEIQTHGKQDRSSGVIQDRGSGLRQDSCGSTKQADNKISDPKEVESRRFNSQGMMLSQHNNNIMDDDEDDDDDDDDTSSGSSSPLKDSFLPQNVDRLCTITSKYPTHIDVKNVKGRAGPSGYLKVKGQVENAAITAVKRQLGKYYREDGPPLGIEFESLPPGAFENPVKIPINQSYYVGDRTALHPPDGSRTFQLPTTSKMYERYNPMMYQLNDLDLEMRHASKHREIQYKQPPPSKHRNSLPGRTEVNYESAHEHFEMRTKYTDNRHGKNNQAENYTRSWPPKVFYREPITSDLQGEFEKTLKDDEFFEERRGIDEYSKRVPAKINPGNDLRVIKRSRDEHAHQGYPRKEANLNISPRTTQTKRPTMKMTTSFSDDDTAETTSSRD